MSTEHLENNERNNKDIPRRKRAGRRKLSEEKRRAGRIGVPVNEAEKKIIADYARTLSMTPAVFLRQLGLNHRPPRPIPAINYKSYRTLIRMGKNLNRTLMLIESGYQVGISPEFTRQMIEVTQTIRRMLLGGVDDGDRENQ